MELKVTTKKNPDFYTRSARDFMEGKKDCEPVEEMTISGLGNAIPCAVQVAGTLESEGKAEILQIRTGYPAGQRETGIGQIRISLKSKIPVPSMLPERLQTKEMAPLVKAVQKEGGKRGVEIEGAGDMGGLQFFCTQVEKPAGDPDLLVESMRAMNAKSNPDDEERKGGSGKIGKMIFSLNDDQIAIVAYTPQDLIEKAPPKEWLEDVLEKLGAPKELVVKGPVGLRTATIKKDEDKNLFPLKLKDSGIQFAINYLKKRGLFPDKQDDSDDEYCFGDDDFPTA